MQDGQDNDYHQSSLSQTRDVGGNDRPHAAALEHPAKRPQQKTMRQPTDRNERESAEDAAGITHDQGVVFVPGFFHRASFGMAPQGSFVALGLGSTQVLKYASAVFVVSASSLSHGAARLARRRRSAMRMK